MFLLLLFLFCLISNPKFQVGHGDFQFAQEGTASRRASCLLQGSLLLLCLVASMSLSHATCYVDLKNCFPRLRVAENHYISPDHPLSAFHLPPHQFLCTFWVDVVFCFVLFIFFLAECNEVSWTASPVRYLVYVVIPPGKGLF